MADRSRIAIVDSDRCKPKKCRQECKRSCPVVKTGKHCIEVSSAAKLACISEELCIGCGICVKKCPFEAIQIINLPKSLEKETTHRYGPNTFKLHRLPVPKPGQVLGLVGTNGIGKSTALKVLAGKLKPNLSRFENPPDWQQILAHFRGSELQNYFTCILEDNLKAGLVKPDVMEGEEIEVPKFNVSYKRQKISLEFEGTVREMLGKRIRESYLHPQFISDVMKPLQIEQLMDEKFATLSGGELQRVSICLCLGKPADIYLIDEPSAYLDSEQCIVASKVIKRYILHAKKTAFVVEHDFIMATYLADKVIVYEGKPSIDCVANAPRSLVSGMNLFLSHLDITFRRDPTNYRPRINKLDSAKDREQKNAGSYYYLDD